MRENGAKRVLREGGAVLAISLSFPDAGLAEYLGRLGYHAVIMDGEHGAITDSGVESFARACDAAGVTSMVRTTHNRVLMQRYLDLGVQGFHVSGVRDVDQAREVVDAVKYRPLGNRGMGTSRSSGYGLASEDWETLAERANAETMIKIVIENADGLAALPQIAAIPEIDILSIGATDLADSLGLAGQPNHPKMREAIDRAVTIVKSAGKALGLPIRSSADMIEAHRRGARYMLANVSRVIAHGSTDYLSTLRTLR